MRDYLESLEIGEGKIKLSKEEIKSILAENGKMVNSEVDKTKKDLTTEIDTYKKTIRDLEGKIEKLPKSDELEALQNELKVLKDAEAERTTKKQEEEQDAILTNNIKSVFGDKKFVNEYTESSILADVKKALKDQNNVGKSAKDLFEEITKDKEGIFVNPNAPKDMDGANENISSNVTKEAFDKMGYQDRLSLKRENPDLYQSFVK